MTPEAIKEKFIEIKGKRDFLLNLLEQPNLGNLRIDVNQALEELDELVEEFKIAFPEENI
ncbi:MAG: hypothetical protein QNJ54_33810 [Prochloraceae cyanobacterium]|nr:hypothetical protein [Prochloraceae cyanobacterium]